MNKPRLGLGIFIGVLAGIFIILGCQPPAQVGVIKTIPGEPTTVKTTRVELVDGKGEAVLAMYEEGGTAKLSVKTAKGIKTIDMAAMVTRLSGFLAEKDQ